MLASHLTYYCMGTANYSNTGSQIQVLEEPTYSVANPIESYDAVTRFSNTGSQTQVLEEPTYCVANPIECIIAK